jgi:hypothetical protein
VLAGRIEGIDAGFLPPGSFNTRAMDQSAAFRFIEVNGGGTCVLAGRNQAWPQATESHLQFAKPAARETD